VLLPIGIYESFLSEAEGNRQQPYWRERSKRSLRVYRRQAVQPLCSGQFV